MAGKLALTSTTGKLGSAVLSALLEHNLIPASDIIICSSSPDVADQNDNNNNSNTSNDKFAALRQKGITTIRHATYSSPTSMTTAFTGATRLFLVSTPHVEMDYNDAPPGTGREAHHFAAIDAALEAGVEHIYYTSLGFGGGDSDGDEGSKAAVMWAHERTEAYLAEKMPGRYTVLREGLYSESWPLYMGYFDVEAAKRERRGRQENTREARDKAGKVEKIEVVVAGDGEVSWTAIEDLGLATALVLVGDLDVWGKGRVVTLSGLEAYSLEGVAGLVSDCLRQPLSRGDEEDASGSPEEDLVVLKVVDTEEYVRYHVVERGMDEAAVRWWAHTYNALPRGECKKRDSTLTDLLGSMGKRPIPFKDTVTEMIIG